VAELQVGIRADVKDAKRVVKSLKDIKRAAGESSASLSAAAKTAKTASTSYNVTSGSALKLAGATDLTAAANAALTKSLAASAAATARQTASQQAAAATASALAAATTRTNLASRALSATKTRLIGIINATTAAFGRMGAAGVAAYTSISASAKRFGTQARTALGSVVGASTAAAGIGATIAVGFGVGAKSAVQFETTLSRIEGLVGIAKNEVEAFKKPILELGKAVGKGPNELAEALFFVTSAGFKGKDALDVLDASAKAAAAGLGETKQVADAVTSAVNAYGLENLTAAQSTDILVATVREGKAEADSIAGALGQVLPAASELGVEFSELGGTIAALTRIGLGADQGATALGATLAAIQKPGADAKKALTEFGTSASQLRQKVQQDGLLAALQDLQERFGDNEEALTRVFPNIRALRAILPLVGKNAGDVAGIFERVADSAGSTDKAFAAVEQTSGQKLRKALVQLQTSLQEIGEVILPAITIAFESLVAVITKLAEGFTKVRDVAKGASEALAEAFVGSDDPVIRNLNNIRELRDELERLQSGGKIRTFFTEVGGIDLTGSRDEQIKQLEERLALERIIEQQTGREILARQRANSALEDAADIVADIKNEVDPPIVVLDEERQKKALTTLEDLKDEVSFLRMEATNLQELGQEGIGLAEDFQLTSQLARDLQRDVAADAVTIRTLVNEKRKLEEQINEVNAAFQRQDAATQFLDDLVADTKRLEEQIASLQGGGSLFDIQSLQQARDIYADLSAEQQALTSVSDIQSQIQLQKVLNDTLAAMPTDKMKDFADSIAFLEQQRGLAKTEEEIARINGMIATLGQGAIQEVFNELGIAEVPFDSLEAQFQNGYDRIKAAFDLAGIVDPESDPRFQAAIDRLQEKIFGIGDIMKEFGKAAAQNLQSSFSDFLFDPFSEGLDGMARKFGETLRRLAADILANQILTSFFKSLAGAGGGIGSFGQAALGALGGNFAEGGDFSGNKPILVGERGPEIITPRQSGTVIPNEMLQPQPAAAPEVNVAPAPVIVLDDPAKIGRALSTDQNTQRALVDAISTKKSAINQALS
jgi:TP901 family phage tail tape measure protein